MEETTQEGSGSTHRVEIPAEKKNLVPTVTINPQPEPQPQTEKTNE
jgi:hypothetical protein